MAARAEAASSDWESRSHSADGLGGAPLGVEAGRPPSRRARPGCRPRWPGRPRGRRPSSPDARPGPLELPGPGRELLLGAGQPLGQRRRLAAATGPAPAPARPGPPRCGPGRPPPPGRGRATSASSPAARLGPPLGLLEPPLQLAVGVLGPLRRLGGGQLLRRQPPLHARRARPPGRRGRVMASRAAATSSRSAATWASRAAAASAAWAASRWSSAAAPRPGGAPRRGRPRAPGGPPRPPRAPRRGPPPASASAWTCSCCAAAKAVSTSERAWSAAARRADQWLLGALRLLHGGGEDVGERLPGGVQLGELAREVGAPGRPGRGAARAASAAGDLGPRRLGGEPLLERRAVVARRAEGLAQPLAVVGEPARLGLELAEAVAQPGQVAVAGPQPVAEVLQLLLGRPLGRRRVARPLGQELVDPRGGACGRARRRGARRAPAAARRRGRGGAGGGTRRRAGARRPARPRAGRAAGVEHRRSGGGRAARRAGAARPARPRRAGARPGAAGRPGPARSAMSSGAAQVGVGLAAAGAVGLDGARRPPRACRGPPAWTGSARFSRLQTEKPLMSGSSAESRMRSGAMARHRSTAASPEASGGDLEAGRAEGLPDLLGRGPSRPRRAGRSTP